MPGRGITKCSELERVFDEGRNTTKSYTILFTSFISKRSISSSSRPAAFTAAGIATAGPTPMMAGSTPTTTNVLHGQNDFMWEK